MKNIKKYLVYFTICLVSLFVFSNNVSAMQRVMFYFDYNSTNFNNTFTSTLFEKLETLKAHIETYNVHEREYVISVNSEKVYVGLLLAQNSNQNLYSSGEYFIISEQPSVYNNRYSLNYGISPSQAAYYSISSAEITLSDFLIDNTSTFYSRLDNFLNNGQSSNSVTLNIYGGILSKNESWFSSRNYSIYVYDYQSFVYYSSLPLKLNTNTLSNSINNMSIQDACNNNNQSSFDNMLIFNDSTLSQTLSCGDTFKTYYDFIQANSQPITTTITTYKIEDEINNTEYNYKANINILIDNDYSEYNTICSFTDSFNNITNFNVSVEYDYVTWSNGTLNCSIKDGNEIIEEYTYSLSTLANTSIIDTYSTSLNDNTLYSLNVNYSFYGTSYIPEYIPFKVEYFSQESTTKTTFINGTKFYYTNGNSQRFETNLLKLKDYKCNKTHANYIICNGYIDNSETRFSNFEVNFLLDSFNEETNLLYYDNLPFNFYDRNVDFLSTDFVGYKRYNLDPNRNRVYIYKSSTNASDTGNIYFPYTLNHSNTIDMIAFYYSPNGTFDSHLPSTDYNDYYEYYSINFDNTSGVLIITFDSTNFDIIDSDAYIYVPNEWYVQMQGTTHLGVVLTDNDGNKIIISNEYNNTLINKAYNINSLFGGVTNYLDSIKKYTNFFSDEITYFWGKLNNEQQTFLVSMFMLIVITSIIVLARRH